MEMNNESVLLRMEGITKEFPGVKALDGVNLTVRAGTVHALMGENGAGKSTLMKCLFGVYKKDGGKIYLAEDIHFSYYCRNSIRGIATMARKNGMWNVITMRLCPGAMGVRHFIPFAFVLSLLGLSMLSLLHWSFGLLLGLECLLYLLLDILFSAKQASSVKEFFALLPLFPIFHISYGIGSVIGIIKLFSKEFKKGSYTPSKL